MKTQILTSAIFMHLVSCGTQQGLKLEDDRIIQDTTNQIPQKPSSDAKAPSVVKKDSPQSDGLEKGKILMMLLILKTMRLWYPQLERFEFI